MKSNYESLTLYVLLSSIPLVCFSSNVLVTAVFSHTQSLYSYNTSRSLDFRSTQKRATLLFLYVLILTGIGKIPEVIINCSNDFHKSICSFFYCEFYYIYRQTFEGHHDFEGIISYRSV